MAAKKRRKKQIKKPQSKKGGKCHDKVVTVKGHGRSPRGNNGGKPRVRTRSYRRSRPC